MANVVFDFDGTIADSLLMIVGMFNGWSNKVGPIDPKEIKRLRKMPLRTVLEEVRIPPWKLPWIIVRGRREMSKHLNEIAVFDGVTEVIKELHGSGNHLYIMSSNSARNIRRFLKIHNMQPYFIRIYGGAGILGKGAILERVISQNNLDRKVTYYIGDETRDIQAAHKTGIQSIAVTWGFNDEELLKHHHPYKIAKKPADIIHIINSELL